MSTSFLLASFLGLVAVCVAGACNPLNSACPPNVGLENSSYAIDFTQQTTIPPDWTLSNYASIKFGSQGAEFTVAKHLDSPQLWTNFYLQYAKIEVVAQIAPGTGIVSSAVLMSDDADEIDLEFSGNNFGDTSSSGKGQNNYYGKGIVGNYDRGSFFNVASPQTQFHTYAVDWTSSALTWSVDGTAVRTLNVADTDNGAHQYPQTPAKFQLGIWAGGDSGNAWGTVDWAGGYTDYSTGPFTMYVKSVKITNYNPAYAYNWTDKTGSSNSIKVLQNPVLLSSSAAVTSTPVSPQSASRGSSIRTAPTSSTVSSVNSATSSSVTSATTCAGAPAPARIQDGIIEGCTQWYTAKPGDTCLKISSMYNIPIETFMQWNPAVGAPLCYNMWLNYGYCVSTDCSLVSSSSLTSAGSTSSSATASSSSVVVVSSNSLPIITLSATSSQATSRPQTSFSSSTSVSSSSSGTTSNLSSSSSASPGSTGSQSTSISSSTTAPSPVPSSNSCPNIDGRSLTSGSGKSYTIKCSSDSHQGSYTNAHAANSFADCMDACDAAASTGCQAWTYVGGSNGNGSGTCWLKTASGFFVPAGNNYISGSVSPKASSASSISQAAPSTTASSSTVLTTSTSRATSSTPNSSTVSVTSSTSSTVPDSPANLCPQPSSLSFVPSQAGSLYFMRCSSDTDVGSYTNTRASSSYTDCMDACDKSQGCQAFTYVGGNYGNGDGTCWLKSAQGNAWPAGPNYVAGFLAARAPSSSATSIAATTTSIVSSPLSAIKTISTTANSASSSSSSTWAENSAGSNYTLYLSSDTNWGSYTNKVALTSSLDCTTICDNDSKCQAYTYVGAKDGKGPGTCWLKSQLGVLVPANDNVISGSRVTQNGKVRRAVSSRGNSTTSTASAKTVVTKSQLPVTIKPSSPPYPPWARYYPHGGRWMWNGHGNWEWAWN